ncbi:MAG TPA: YgiT-type zinc finger protein [Ktedonobacterales bacterium]
MATLAEKLAGLQCPRCGREDTYAIRDVEYTARVGHDTVTVIVMAGVCTNCGETVFDSAATKSIEVAVDKLRSGHTDGLIHAGEAYEAR